MLCAALLVVCAGLGACVHVWRLLMPQRGRESEMTPRGFPERCLVEVVINWVRIPWGALCHTRRENRKPFSLCKLAKSVGRCTSVAKLPPAHTPTQGGSTTCLQVQGHSVPQRMGDPRVRVCLPAHQPNAAIFPQRQRTKHVSQHRFSIVVQHMHRRSGAALCSVHCA